MNRPLFTCVLSWFGRWAASPTSVGFMARAACCRVDCRARQKPPSSLTRKRVHGRTGLRVWTGFNDGFGNPDGVTQWHSESRRRLVSCCFASGPPASPRHPFGKTPFSRKTCQDFGRERAGEPGRAGLSSRYSETRPRSLDPPGRFFDRIGVVARSQVVSIKPAKPIKGKL